VTNSYDPHALVDKWLPRWQRLRAFDADGLTGGDERAPRSYVVSMYPYPSGDLHMGHAEVYAISDAIARFHRLRGDNVLSPIGWDSFGLPAENAALKRGLDPGRWTYANVEVQAESFRRLGVSFDWRTRLHTSDPEYYRWNQWLFLRMFEKGLAYRKAAPVNWCPTDKTVLANEQVIQGHCERCGSVVVRRNLTQWFFRTTAFAQRLLDDMEQLEGAWPDDILAMQRNWIGRSTGARIDFHIEGRAERVQVFTTRPDTLFGATFIVVAADAPLADELWGPPRPAPRARRARGIPAADPIRDRHRAPGH
jgi:leucyl-tRNA synthetase